MCVPVSHLSPAAAVEVRKDAPAKKHVYVYGNECVFVCMRMHE